MLYIYVRINDNKTHREMKKVRRNRNTTLRARLAKRMKSELLGFDVEVSARSYKSCGTDFINLTPVNGTWNDREINKIIELASFYGMTGVYGMKLSTVNRVTQTFQVN